MPRELLYGRYWDRVKEAQERLGPGVADAYYAMGHLQFIDYWPDVPATLPEKMVFAWLVEHQINFYFSWYFGDLAITPEHKEHVRPDFYLPDYKLIIEVAGLYWHSRAGSFEYDFERDFWLTATGYTVYPIIDIEILANTDDAIRHNVPELASPQLHGTLHAVGDRPIDPNAAIGARMRKYPRQFTAKWKPMGAYRTPTEVQDRYGALRGPRKARPPMEAIFLGFGAEVTQRIKEYGKAYSRYQWLLKIWEELETNWQGNPADMRRLEWLTNEYDKVLLVLEREIF
jgi:hypothetical protein